MLAGVIVLAVGIYLLIQGIRMKGEKGDRNIALLMVVSFVIRSLLVVGGKLLGFDEGQLVRSIFSEYINRFLVGIAAGAFLALVVGGGWARLIKAGKLE